MVEVRELVIAAFERLLLESCYEKITVAALCEEASVSRRTFYRSFGSVDSIVEAFLRGILVDPVFRVRSVLPLDEMKSSTMLVIESTYSAINEKREVFAKLLDYRGPKSLALLMIDLSIPMNAQLFERYIPDPGELEYAVRFVSGAQAMLIDWWIRDNPDVSPTQLAKYSTAWIFSHFKEIAESPLSYPEDDLSTDP